MEKLFLDTEFTGLHQYTSLASIGIVSESGKEFYFENIDYKQPLDRDKDFFEKNVLSSMKFINNKDVVNEFIKSDYKGDFGKINYNVKDVNDNIQYNLDGVKDFMDKVEGFGTLKFIAKVLTEWINYHFDQVKIWSDVYSYDWVLFNQMFGHAFDIPERVYYIPFDIATFFEFKGIDPDVNREAFASMQNDNDIDKHNALWDAKVIKECYKILELTY